MKIQVYFSGVFRKSWKWRLIAKNGKILASGKGFNTKELCEDSVNLIRDNIVDAEFTY